MRIAERQLRSFIRGVLEDKSSSVFVNSQKHVLAESSIGDWWEKTKKGVKRKADKIFNREKFIKDLYEERLSAYLKPRANTDKANETTMSFINDAKSKSDDISFIVMSFAGFVPEKIYIDQSGNVPELFGEVLTDITQMCGNADARLKSMLLYKNTRQWEESFWNDTPRLKSLKSEFSPELQRDLAGIAASFVKVFLKRTPVIFMVSDEDAPRADRVEAWRNATGFDEYVRGFWSAKSTHIVMNCVTYSIKDDKSKLDTVMEHEVIHAKTDYTNWASVILLKLYENNFEVKSDTVDEGSHEAYVRDFYALTKTGWAASCLEVPSGGDYSRARDCFNRMKEMLSNELEGSFSEEVIANFEVLVRMTTDQKPGEGFRLPDIANNESIQFLMNSPDVSLVIRQNPILRQIFKKKLFGDYEYNPDNYGYILNLGSMDRQGEKVNFLSIAPKFTTPIAFPSSIVEDVLDRANDLSNDHHIYNALMFLQMLAYSAFNQGYDFMRWADENFQVEGNIVRGKGKGAAAIMIDAIRSQKFKKIDEENRRRVCLLIFASMLNREGDLPSELLNMALSMADAKGVMKRDPSEDDVRTA